jgi:hypothetical protein
MSARAFVLFSLTLLHDADCAVGSRRKLVLDVTNDTVALAQRHRESEQPEAVGMRGALAEVKRRVTLLRNHLKAELLGVEPKDDPYCIPCSNRASPKMLETQQTCEETSLDQLVQYCPGTEASFEALQRLSKSQHGIMRAWIKQYRQDGQGYCKAQCQAAGRPYDDTNCCPITMPGAATSGEKSDSVDEAQADGAPEQATSNPLLHEE